MPVDSDGKLIKDRANLSVLSKTFPQAPWGQSRCNLSQPLIMQGLSHSFLLGEKKKKKRKRVSQQRNHLRARDYGSERMKEPYVGNRDCCGLIRRHVSLARRNEKLSYFSSLFLLPSICVSLEMRHEKAQNLKKVFDFSSTLFLNHCDEVDYCFLLERLQLSWKQKCSVRGLFTGHDVNDAGSRMINRW